jgi:hypothetical protein
VTPRRYRVKIRAVGNARIATGPTANGMGQRWTEPHLAPGRRPEGMDYFFASVRFTGLSYLLSDPVAESTA